MEDLIGRMTHEDPARRPQIEQVLQNFTNIHRSLSKSKLRSVITPRNVPEVFGLVFAGQAKLRSTILSRKVSKGFRVNFAGTRQLLSTTLLAIRRTVLVLCCASNSSDHAYDF
jgi:hypothetical protein